jgi:hypothetical protein
MSVHGMPVGPAGGGATAAAAAKPRGGGFCCPGAGVLLLSMLWNLVKDHLVDLVQE